ncbi:MAG: restriction endonuclease [Saprospiraceae bacterium]|nr:restriction endonuclease [Saprospiraceae bacterium]
MKKGKFFESVVSLIQSSLVDKLDTEVLTNVKIKDLSGVSREIDVLIRSIVNEMVIQIALECKDHSRPVEREKIDAFHGKCSALPGINKKVFISSLGFQSGAVKGAKQYGVDLYTLEEINEDEIFKWLCLIKAESYVGSRHLTRIGATFISNPIQVEEDDRFLIDGVPCELSLKQFVVHLIGKYLPVKVVLIRYPGDDEPKENEHNLNFKLYNVAIYRNNILSQINTLFLQVRDIYTSISSKMDARKYAGYSSVDKFVNVKSIVSERGDIFSLIEKDGSNCVEIWCKNMITAENRDQEVIIKVGEIIRGD